MRIIKISKTPPTLYNKKLANNLCVSGQELFARSHGVDARYKDELGPNLALANYVNSAIKLMLKAGIKPPRGLKIRIASDNHTDFSTGTRFAQYESEDKTIRFSPLFFRNKRAMSEIHQILKRTDGSQSNHDLYVVVHEFGHALHHEAMGKNFLYCPRDPNLQPLTPWLENYFSNNLGSNSLKDRFETVADIFAHVLLDKLKLDPTVWRLYEKEYGGPYAGELKRYSEQS